MKRVSRRSTRKYGNKRRSRRVKRGKKSNALSVKALARSVFQKMISPPTEVLFHHNQMIRCAENKRSFAIISQKTAVAPDNLNNGTHGEYPFMGYNMFDAMRSEYLAQRDLSFTEVDNQDFLVLGASRRWTITSQEVFPVFIRVHILKMKMTTELIPLQIIQTAVGNFGATAEDAMDANPFTTKPVNTGGYGSYAGYEYTTEPNFNVFGTNWYKDLDKYFFDRKSSPVIQLNPGDSYQFAESCGRRIMNVNKLLYGTQTATTNASFQGLTTYVILESLSSIGDESADTYGMGYPEHELIVHYKDRMLFQYRPLQNKATAIIATGGHTLTATDLEFAGVHDRVNDHQAAA